MQGNTASFKQNAGKHFLIPTIFLVCVLITGLSTYRDYGMSWDEEVQMRDVGKANYDFIADRNAQQLLDNPEKYHGPAFEIALYALQRISGKTSGPEAYYFRHLITFLLFFMGGVLLYKLLLDLRLSILHILFGLGLYFLMPRIYADAFYNSKDIPQLVLVVAIFYTFFKVLHKLNWSNVLFHGVVCGVAIAIRNTSVIFPFISVCLLFFFYSIVQQRPYSLLLKHLAGFTIACAAFTIICWPVLWLDPAGHFLGAFKEMKAYQWHSTVRFMGENVATNQLPWYYVPVWIGISTPVVYLVLSAIGVISLIRIPSNQLKQNSAINWLGYYAVLMILGTILSIIILHSIVYDGWRHLYFLYAGCLMLSIAGMLKIEQYLAGQTVIKWLFRTTLILYFGGIILKMYALHPYQNIYFNFTAGVTDEDPFRYELDYWGLSYRESIDKLIQSENNYPLKVNFSNLAGSLSLNLLDNEASSKIRITTLDSADFYITNYRWLNEYPPFRKIDSVTVDGIEICGTYNLKQSANYVKGFGF